MTCPGAMTRVSNRPHPFCRGDRSTPACDLFTYGAELLPGHIKPALIDADGVATCPNRCHAGSVSASPESRAPKV